MKKTISIFVIGLLIVGGLGAVAMDIDREKLDSVTTNCGHNGDGKRGYTYTVFVEVATSQACGPYYGMDRNLYNLYTSRDYGFKFVEMIIYDHKTRSICRDY